MCLKKVINQKKFTKILRNYESWGITEEIIDKYQLTPSDLNDIKDIYKILQSEEKKVFLDEILQDWLEDWHNKSSPIPNLER